MHVTEIQDNCKHKTVYTALSWKFLVFARSKYRIRKTKWKGCVRKRRGGMVECRTTARERLWLPRKTCVDSLDSNRTCLHVDLVRDCRKKQRTQRGGGGSRGETERRRKREKTFNSNCRSSEVCWSRIFFLYHSNYFHLFLLNLSVRHFVRPLCHFFFSVPHKWD
jgi:hypothetical protein